MGLARLLRSTIALGCCLEACWLGLRCIFEGCCITSIVEYHSFNPRRVDAERHYPYELARVFAWFKSYRGGVVLDEGVHI